MDIGYLAALLAGALSLLSPCGALLLPAWFAAQHGGPGRLLARALAFWLGLLVLLVPLGAGMSFAGSAVSTHRQALTTAAGLLIVALGVVSLLGGGFDPGRWLPARWRRPMSGGGLMAAWLLGVVSGVAGFCSGPVLGAILTVAAAGGSAAFGASLMAVYAMGMVVPLLAVSALWRRAGSGGGPGGGHGGGHGRALSWLRGREIRIGPIRTHTTSILTGLLLIGVGVLFLATDGLATAPDLIPATRLAQWQADIARFAGSVPDPLVLAVAAGLALILWYASDRRHR